ncbi:MAG TPA: hypothetical protein VKV27_00945 [Solirubrobacteraceae bacterium]|nr:hypothetical protein [Solirubrobacteraceae bacterium]
MFRHVVRCLIKPGEHQQFVQAFGQLNAALPAADLPAYRLWRTLFGDLNEVFAEAEYDSLDAHVAAWGKASGNEEFQRHFRAMLSHTVPGTLRDYPLEPLDLT